jgi:hypothetical protein
MTKSRRCRGIAYERLTRRAGIPAHGGIFVFERDRGAAHAGDGLDRLGELGSPNLILTLADFGRTIAVVATQKKQLSREEIHALRGSLKRKPGDKPFAEQWAEYKREEKELEDRKFQRLAKMGKK